MRVKVNISFRAFESQGRVIVEVVAKDILVVMGHAEPGRQSTPVVGDVHVPVVRRRAQQRRLVAPARNGCFRAGVAIICRESNSTQRAGQKRKVLLPVHFKAGYVRLWPIDRLSLMKSGKRAAGNDGLHEIDGIRQVLVEPSHLYHTDLTEVMLKQKI